MKDLYDQLRDTDERRYNEFRAKLALEGCLAMFERRVCKPDYNLKRVDFRIADCLMKYLEGTDRKGNTHWLARSCTGRRYFP